MKSSLFRFTQRKLQSGKYNTPIGRIALFCAILHPDLKQCLGVYNQYLVQMETSIQSEGAKAIDRYKSYKREFLRFIDEKTYPKRGKFRHLVPLLRIVERNNFSQESIVSVHTVCRALDLYKAPSKVVDQKEQEFIDKYLANTPQVLLSYIGLEDESFRLAEVEELIREIINDFPDSKTAKAYAKAFPLKPVDEALFLYRRGTSKVRKRGSKNRTSAPSIIGAPYDAWRHSKKFISSRFLGRTCTSWELIQESMDYLGSKSFPQMRCKRLEITEPPFEKWGSEYIPDEPLVELVAFPDKGYKVRCIRKASYYIQYVLQPIHDSLMRVLRALPNDYTRDHDEGFRQLIYNTHVLGKKAYCFDMSNATDSMPASYEYYIMRARYGSKIADIWWDVLTQHENQHGFEKLGQPMGSLSSWPTMAEGNHDVAYLAAKRAGKLEEVLKNPQHYFIVVGDDIVIFDPVIALHYQNIMRVLGIPVNLSKSFINDDKHFVTEFVKRNSWHGKEISAISPNLITKSFEDIGVCLTLLKRIKDMFNFEYGDMEYLISLFSGFGHGLVRDLVVHLSELPQQLGGINDSDGSFLTMSPAKRKFIILAKIGTLLKWRYNPSKVLHNGKDISDEISQWLSTDVYGLRPNDAPLASYNRKKSKSNDVIRNLLIQTTNAHRIESFLESTSNTEEALSLLESLASQEEILSGVPFFGRREVEHKMLSSFAYRVKDGYHSENDTDYVRLLKRETSRILNIFPEYEQDAQSTIDDYAALFNLFDECEEDNSVAMAPMDDNSSYQPTQSPDPDLKTGFGEG